MSPFKTLRGRRILIEVPVKKESVITFAEEEANKIIEKLKTTKVEQPKKTFFSRK